MTAEAASPRVEEIDGGMRVSAAGVPLADYVVEPATPSSDSPKPYLHPLWTTAGEEVTAVRPHDHTWHNGLQFAVANLAGENFWGGRTYLRDKGYTPLDNNGSIEHLRWRHTGSRDGRAELSHDLTWRTRTGEEWLTEQRVIEIDDVDPEEGCWTLTWTSRLRNISETTLRWGSPVTEGRDTAGYGGLFWRGPRSFVGGTVRTSDGVLGDDAMGHRAPWLAFTGRHDVSLRSSTLLFVDCPSNPTYPTPWYVRADPFPVVSFAVTYHRPWLFRPGEELSLTHHVVVLDGEWDASRLERHVERRVAPRWKG